MALLKNQGSRRRFSWRRIGKNIGGLNQRKGEKDWRIEEGKGRRRLED